MDRSIGDRVLYTRYNGILPRWVESGESAVQDGVSFAIPNSDSPPDCPPSPLPNTQSSSPPKAPGPSQCHKNQKGPPQCPLQSRLGRLILSVFPKGVPRGSSGEHGLKVACSARAVQGGKFGAVGGGGLGCILWWLGGRNGWSGTTLVQGYMVQLGFLWVMFRGHFFKHLWVFLAKSRASNGQVAMSSFNSGRACLTAFIARWPVKSRERFMQHVSRNQGRNDLSPRKLLVSKLNAEDIMSKEQHKKKKGKHRAGL